jgi:hypothetical protein
MTAVVFRQRQPVGRDPIELGHAEMDGDGARIVAADGHDLSWVAAVAVFDEQLRRVTPADGIRYLEALPRAFAGTHFWAVWRG